MLEKFRYLTTFQLIWPVSFEFKCKFQCSYRFCNKAKKLIVKISVVNKICVYFTDKIAFKNV